MAGKCVATTLRLRAAFVLEGQINDD